MDTKTPGVQLLDLLISDPMYFNNETDLMQYLDEETPGTYLLDIAIGESMHLDHLSDGASGHKSSWSAPHRPRQRRTHVPGSGSNLMHYLNRKAPGARLQHLVIGDLMHLDAEFDAVRHLDT